MARFRKRRSAPEGNKDTTVSTTFRSIVCRKEFGWGFKDAVKGLPFSEDYDKMGDKQWSYERGRLVGTQYRVYFNALNRKLGTFKKIPALSKVKDSVISLFIVMWQNKEVR